MGLFAPPPRLDPWMLRMLAELRAIDAWAAQFPAPAATASPARRRKRAAPRQVRAIVRNLDKAGLNLDRIEVDSTSGRVTALVNTGGAPAKDNDLDAEIAEIDRRLYGAPRE